jgi:LacI family transcriptional regulator
MSTVPGGKARQPTIRDVAAAAGVSMSTVSAALNGSAPTSTDVRSRVAAAVERLGYQPEAHARSLRLRRSSAIGLVIPDPGNPFFIELAMGVQTVALAEGLVVVLCATDRAAELDAYCLSLLKARHVDGLVYVSGTHEFPDSLQQLRASVPIVFVDDLFTDVEGAFVGADNRAGAALAARLLLDQGHRRIGILAGPHRVWTAQERLRGYLDALSEAGLEVAAVPVEHGDFRVDGGRAAAAALLARDPDITGVLAANDLMAIGALQVYAERGLRVPHDISVVGFDDIPAATFVTPNLTTVRQPARDIGHAAMSSLLRQLNEGIGTEMTLLPTTLVTRNSVGRPHD